MDLLEDSRMKPGFGMSPRGFALNPEMLLFLVSQTQHAALTQISHHLSLFDDDN